ncbi:MAG: hypothetical protein AAGH83_04305 [Pseudomonadota bacterium]
MAKTYDTEQQRHEAWRKGMLAKAEAALSDHSEAYRAQMLEYYRRTFDLPPEYLPYGHYVYGETLVMIIKSRTSGLKVVARKFKPETQYQEIAHTFMSKIEADKDGEAEEITEDDFLLLCLAQAARLRAARS